ncbi:MAG: S8 family serine peptidase [Bacilli bacterium]|nr:S8 family serine peptidase [Bacilli bacterium]
MNNRIIYEILKIICSLVLLVLTALVVLVRNSIIIIAKNYVEEKLYSNVKIDDSFDDSSVLVVMKKNVSEVNKKYDKAFFSGILIDDIYDLTYTNIKITDESSVNMKEFRQILQLKLTIKTKQNVIDTIHEIEKIDDVLWVGPNNYEYSNAQPASASVPPSGIHRYPLLWGLHSEVGINAEEAWDFSTGNSAIKVAVIDTGMFNHSDISANISTSGGDFVNMTDIYTNTPGPLSNDPNGHGTHVSGIIGATGMNPNGVTGVAWNVELIPLQVSYWDSNELEYIWDIAAVTRAIYWAAVNGVDIINYSGGGDSDNVARKDAIAFFSGLFIAASGNGGDDEIADNNDIIPVYPSDYSHNQSFSDRVISVGAYMEFSTGDLTLAVQWPLSNYGEESVSIFAPGHNILSTVPENVDDSEYISWPGTSMATPYVTGTAAILWNILDNSPANYTKSQIASIIKSSIINSAITNDLGTPFNNLCVADGRLDAYGAVKYTLTTYASIPYTLNGNTINISHTVLANNDYFINDNGFYKLNVTYSNEYDFNISASYPIDVILYDSNFNQLSYTDLNNSNNVDHFIKYLSTGTYYLRVKFSNGSQSGTINTQISIYNHIHSYSYEWLNLTEHNVECECGYCYTQVHAITQGPTPPGQPYKTCIICGGYASMGIVPFTSNNLPRTINGSYILPNGVIVLADADIDAYLNGTLSFTIYKETKYTKMNRIPPFIITEEEEYKYYVR